MEDSTLKILLEMWGISRRSVVREAKKVERELAMKDEEIIDLYYFTKDYRDRENMMYAVNHLVSARVVQITVLIIALTVAGFASALVALNDNLAPLTIWLLAGIAIVLLGRNILRSYKDYFGEYVLWREYPVPLFNRYHIFENVCSMVAERYNVDIWFPHF